MLKIKKEIFHFDRWYKKLNKKMFVVSNPGVGDLIISANIAKFLNTGVLQYTNFDYRKKFANEYCNFLKIPYFQISNDEKLFDYIKFDKKYKFIQHIYFPIYLRNNKKNVDKIMYEIFNMNLNFSKQEKIGKKIFICPSGSSEDKQMSVLFFKKIIKYFFLKKYKIYCVGIEKDIEKYGIDENFDWINTNEIIKINKKEKINIEKFLEIVSTASLSITTETSFHIISIMLKIFTITMFKYNFKNEPIFNDDSMLFFTNLNWCKNCIRLTYEEIFEYLDCNLNL